MKRSFDLSNPLLAYTMIWASVLFLTSLMATTNLLALNSRTLILVISNMISFFIIYGVVSFLFPSDRNIQANPNRHKQVIKSLARFVKGMLGIWIVGEFIEIGYSKGLPIVWAFTHSAKNYMDFGIPSFHGLMNAIYLFSITALFFIFWVTRKKQYLLLIGVLLIWPLLVIGRSLLLGALVQMFAVYLLFGRLNYKRLFQIAIMLLIVIVAFGVIGDIRGEDNPFKTLVSRDYVQLFDRLPSGFLWGYVYLTSPINNVIANIDKLSPDYTPFYSLINTVPTVIREAFISDNSINPIRLVVDNLNVSTFYVGFLADFGIVGAMIVVAVIQFFISIVYVFARRQFVWGILVYAVLYECIIFSVFFNLLMLPVYLMQVFLAIVFGIYIYNIQHKQNHFALEQSAKKTG